MRHSAARHFSKALANQAAICALAIPMLACAWAIPARAAPEAATPSAPTPAEYHAGPAAQIVVTGVLPRYRNDVLSGVEVLSGTHLDQVLRPSIGETLAHVPGVSATSFGPTASRPVLRGLQGERVRVLVNGIGSIDVANTSVDHAPAVNPLLADRIEVLRGPQALLYGSSAVGGVVNVIDKRIPSQIPQEAAHISALAAYGSAANERSLSGAVDVPLGGGFVAHADASRSQSDDLKIAGHALTKPLRQQARQTAADGTGSPDIDYAANANTRYRLPNTAATSWEAAGALAYVGDHGNIGIAFSHKDSLYGVPVRLATLPDQEQEAPRISLVQDRIDARAEIQPVSGFVEKLTARFAYADYRHAEIDPEGAVGTRFFNKGLEGRIELAQAEQGAWRGASGLQFTSRDFNVEGDEAFLPKNSTRQTGLFTLQQLNYGPLKLEAGLRYENTLLTAQPMASQSQFFAGQRRFDTFSFSGGASYKLVNGWTLGFSASRTARAPAAEELFANGPHAGTQAFEVGDPALRVEKATSGELLLRGTGKNYSFELSAFQTWFDDFIYETPTGNIEDGLPEFQMRQSKARFAGFEAQTNLVLARRGAWTLSADAMVDYVRATISANLANGGAAPRIPPLRAMGGFTLSSPAWDFHGEVERVAPQNRFAAFETRTAGYSLLNAEIGWRPWGKTRPLSFTLGARNLLNVDARRAASFLKDYAPLAGRDIRLSLRLAI